MEGACDGSQGDNEVLSVTTTPIPVHWFSLLPLPTPLLLAAAQQDKGLQSNN